MPNMRAIHTGFSSYQPGQPGFIEQNESSYSGISRGDFKFISNEEVFSFESSLPTKFTEEDPEDTETARTISRANYGAIL